ncbi:MAG: PorT family protein [Bacteroidales bacterium]|nr:PorT family protein [Bacteroidales bacterium]
MKNFVAVSLMAFFALFAVSGQAQVKFGIQGGLDLSKMEINTPGLNFDTKDITGYSVGLISEFKFGDRFLLQPGLLYAVKGTKYTFVGAETTVKPSYLEVPVNLVYQIDMKPTKLLLFAGPYFAYGIGGKYNFNGDNTSKIKYGTGSGNDLKPFDYGLNFGAGLDLSRFELKAQYGLGLANLSPVSSNTIKMSRVIRISLAFFIN